MSDFFTIFKTSENDNTKITKIHDIWAHRMFNLVRISIFWSKSNPGTWKRIELKNSEQTLGARCQIFLQFSKIWKMRIHKWQKCMIFGPIACFRRSRAKKEKWTKYEQTLGHIKSHENFKILFWSRESEKLIFRIFPDFFYEKIRNPGNWNPGGVVTRDSVISSETAW